MIQTEKDRFIETLTNLEKSYHDYSLVELSNFFNCNEKTIREKFKKYGITKQKIKQKSTLSPNNEIENLLELGYSSKEIAEKLNLTVRQITCYRNSSNLGADNNNISRAKSKIILSHKEEQVIIGSLLGDGCIDVNNRERNYHRLAIKHGEKQEQYVWYKYNLLKRFCKEPDKSFKEDKRERFKDHYAVTLRTTTNSLFTDYRNNWYPEEKKVVYRPDFIKLDGLGLAIWIMDDGYKTSDNSIELATDSFTIDDVEFMISELNKWGAISTTSKSNRIRFSTKCIFQLKELVRPYFIESMTYKLSE